MASGKRKDVAMALSAKRVLCAAEFKMTAKGRGMFRMPVEQIRAGREKLLGRWPEGTPPEEIAAFEEMRRRIWENL